MRVEVRCVLISIVMMCAACSSPDSGQGEEEVIVIVDDVSDASMKPSPQEDMAPDSAPALDMPIEPVDMEADTSTIEEDMPMSVDMAEDMAPPAATTLCSDATTLEWSAGPDFAGAARDHHVTFVHESVEGAALHVLGGTNYTGLFADHWRAVVLETGELGVWEPQPALPQPRGGAAHATYDGRQYLLGGRARTMVDTVYVSTLDERGAITGWTTTTALPEVRFHASAVAHEGFMYLTGGVSPDGTVQSDLYMAKIQADGMLAPWTTVAMPEPRSHHASIVYEGYLYLAHGFSGNSFRNATQEHKNIIRAPLDVQTGLPGTWEVVIQEDAAISTLAMTLDEQGCACRFAGLQKQSATQYRYMNEVTCYDLAGEIIPGEERRNASTFGVGRSHMHQAPYYRGHYYIVGGSQGYQDVTGKVEIGTMTRATR